LLTGWLASSPRTCALIVSIKRAGRNVCAPRRSSASRHFEHEE
jgi:hypothetical protein